MLVCPAFIKILILPAPNRVCKSAELRACNWERAACWTAASVLMVISSLNPMWLHAGSCVGPFALINRAMECYGNVIVMLAALGASLTKSS